LETVFAQRHRKARHAAGEEPDGIEKALRDAKGLYELAAVALFGDPDATSRVLSYLNNKWGHRAADTFRELNETGHLGLSNNDDVRGLVADARSLIRNVAT
jgi:hypothetical protein